MPTLHVCSLSRLPATLAATQASHLVTLMANPPVRPETVLADNHLVVGVSDIVMAQDGHVLAGEANVERLVDFARRWDRARPMLIHCFAGISRSTAAAYIVTCALHPHTDEHVIAKRLRLASPSATPNPHLVALADRLLERQGRMAEAIGAIGRGAEAFEGEPFHLPFD
jgi:predicted protein tyrosine phosphatase